MAKILVVDDSVTIRMAANVALKEEGHEVVLANDGVEGLAAAKQRQFELILTDYNMPNMDGAEMVAEIRQLDAYLTTPILVLSTETEATKKEKIREVGGNGWMTKPFSKKKLNDVVNQFL